MEAFSGLQITVLVLHSYAHWVNQHCFQQQQQLPASRKNKKKTKNTSLKDRGDKVRDLALNIREHLAAKTPSSVVVGHHKQNWNESKH